MDMKIEEVEELFKCMVDSLSKHRNFTSLVSVSGDMAQILSISAGFFGYVNVVLIRCIHFYQRLGFPSMSEVEEIEIGGYCIKSFL